MRNEIALTGEITLSGDVLPVGGIREKVLAAKRSGVREVALPLMNEVNVREDVPEPLREGMTFHFVRSVEAALATAYGLPFPMARTRPGEAREEETELVHH